jgi:hypothetical protein
MVGPLQKMGFGFSGGLMLLLCFGGGGANVSVEAKSYPSMYFDASTILNRSYDETFSVNPKHALRPPLSTRGDQIIDRDGQVSVAAFATRCQK